MLRLRTPTIFACRPLLRCTSHVSTDRLHHACVPRMAPQSYACLGVGDPCTDVIADALENVLERFSEERGGSTLVDGEQLQEILRELKAASNGKADSGPELAQVAGGSAANVMVCVSRLAPTIACHFAGAVGDDTAGQEFEQHLKRHGITPHLQIVTGKSSAVCCCLITDDGQRTMFTCLGASTDLSPAALPLSLVPSLSLVHCEGYMLCKSDVLMSSALAARNAGAIFSLDLASFEVVRGCEAALKQVLTSACVDVVFCNEDEAKAVCKLFGEEVAGNGENGASGDTSLVLRAGATLLKHCKLAVITCGGKGAHAVSRDQGTAYCPTDSVKVVDTVGAGDAFCGAFLAGLLQKVPLQACLEAGCLTGTCAVQHQGAIIPDTEWPELRRKVQQLWVAQESTAANASETR
eukprot:jgi/Ulvmu1/10963/UM007_0142.1